MITENTKKVCTICETEMDNNTIYCRECGVELEFIEKKIYTTEDEKMVLKQQFQVMYLAFNQKRIAYQNEIINTKEKRKKERQKKTQIKN